MERRRKYGIETGNFHSVLQGYHAKPRSVNFISNAKKCDKRNGNGIFKPFLIDIYLA